MARSCDSFLSCRLLIIRSAYIRGKTEKIGVISLALYLHFFLTQKLKNEKQLKEHECMQESLENTMEPRDSSLL